MILVVGASGGIGSAVVRELLARGAAVRAVTRSPETADELRALGAEPAVGDLGEPASLGRAFTRVERMYLACPERPAASNALALAEQCGVYHVVAPACTAGDVIDQLQSSSLRWTIVPDAAMAADALTQDGWENTDARLV